MFNYTLTKYLTADFFRDNPFTKAFLELVDEVIFCCYMESREILSQLSFEDMDDNFFLEYQSFFLDGLSTYDINKLDRLTLSEWFSLLHARGELSDLYKLLKFGGSLKSELTNTDFELYNNADVPETVTKIATDGIIYAVTEKNLNLDSDFLINQQIPAGYRIGLIKTLPNINIYSDDRVDLINESKQLIHIIDYGRIDAIKEDRVDITFYRRRQFDQYYTFKQLYQSAYTINELSQFHQRGTFFNGFDIEEPDFIRDNKQIYTGLLYNDINFFITDSSFVDLGFAISGSFVNSADDITLTDIDSEDAWMPVNDLIRNNYNLTVITEVCPDGGELFYQSTLRNNYELLESIEPLGGTFVVKVEEPYIIKGGIISETSSYEIKAPVEVPVSIGGYAYNDIPLTGNIYEVGGVVEEVLLYLEQTSYSFTLSNGMITVNGITDTWTNIHNLGYTETPSVYISIINEPTASGEFRLYNEIDGFYDSETESWDNSSSYIQSLGLLTLDGDVPKVFYKNKIMGQYDIRNYPFKNTPIIQPGIMTQFPTVSFYPAVPAGGQDPVNPSGLNFNQNNIVTVGATYACFPENSTSPDDQYPYIDGSFSAAYTNQASQSIYTYTDHWLLGSSGWDAVSYFIVRNINGKERIQNEGMYNRTLSGVLLTYIDDNDFSIIQILPNGKSIMIYAAKVLRNGEYYYYPLMTNSPGWKTEEELLTAGELGFTLYKDGGGNYIEKKLVRKVSNVSSSTYINIRNIPAYDGSTVLTQLLPGNDVYGKWKEVYDDPNYTYKWQKLIITISGGSEVDGYVDITNSSLQNRVIPVSIDFNMVNSL